MADPAARLIACPHFRWMPGMLARQGSDRIRIHGAGQGVILGQLGRYTAEYDVPDTTHRNLPPRHNPWLPDLDDPATLGALLGLVREVRHSPQAFCAPQADTAHDVWWVVCHGDDSVFAGGTSEAEALIAALEGAP